MAYLKDVNIQASDSPSVDAFSRWRVSQVTTLLDLKYLFDDQPLLVDEETNGTASSSHSTDNAKVTMSTAANGDWIIRETFQRFNYQNGKSHLVLMTFSDFQGQEDITKRVGYYSSSTITPFSASLDGIFLESDQNNVSINVYRRGTAVDQVNQSAWDDPLDGTGASGITIDWEKGNIFAFDFQWLGLGRIRIYLDVDGLLVQVHELNHANLVDEVYMSSPNQPLRWELRQDGASAGTFGTICSTVLSEGAINQVGKVLSSNADDNDLQLNSAGTLYACIGIRLKSTHLTAVVDLIDFDYLAETNDRALWELRLNPTVTGTFAYTGVTNSCVETSVGNQTGGASPTASGGTILASGYVEQQGNRRISIDNAIKLGTAIDGTRDEIVLCVKPINAGLDAYVSFTWRELV